jgi:hypothetical protein
MAGSGDVIMSDHAGKERDRGTLAILLSLFSIVIAVASAIFSYQSNMLTIREKVFDVQADADANILIKQVGGPLQRLASVKLTPTFQEADGNIITGMPVEIPLRDPAIEDLTESGTRYFIDNVKKRVCSRAHGVSFAATCSGTAIYHVKVEYDVEGDVRSSICRPGKCET